MRATPSPMTLSPSVVQDVRGEHTGDCHPRTFALHRPQHRILRAGGRIGVVHRSPLLLENWRPKVRTPEGIRVCLIHSYSASSLHLIKSTRERRTGGRIPDAHSYVPWRRFRKMFGSTKVVRVSSKTWLAFILESYRIRRKIEWA